MQASKLSVAKQRLKLARLSRDAERIERTAQIVLTITDEEIIEVRNPNAPLKIIAILGRGQTEGFTLDKAVLCEVGFNRCRPYVCAQLPHKDRGNFNTVSAREKFFSLSEAQYQLVAPRLFAIMQELTNETVDQWKCGHNNPFLLSTNLNFVGSRGGLAEVLRKV